VTRFWKFYLASYQGLTQPVWMLSLIMLINRSGAMVIPFLGVYMTQALQFSLTETGTVLSCFGIGAMCGSWVGGWLSDRFDHFYIQLLSLLLCVPIFCLLPLLKEPPLLSAGVFTLSLISETFRPANSVALAHYTKPENITKAFSLNRMAVNLGFSVGPALGGFLAAFSYNLLFFGNALSCAIAALVFFFYFRSRKGEQHETRNSRAAQAELKGISPWKDAYFLVFTLLCCFYAICFFQLLSTLPLFYREAHRLDEWSIGLILGFSGLVVFLLEMLLVHIAEKRLSTTAVIVTGTVLCGLSFLMLLIPGGQIVLYASIFVLCISEILAMPFMSTVAMQRSTADTRGAYMGMNSLAFSVAYVLSPYLGTRIAHNWGFDILWLLTGLVICLTAPGFSWVIRRMKM